MLLNLKYYPQFSDYSCAAACLRMVFGHYGKKFSEEKLVQFLSISEKHGVSHEKIIRLVRRLGFVPYEYKNGTVRDLIICLEKGTFPIVNYLEPFSNKGHYAVITGYKRKEKKIILADPRNGDDFTISWNMFKKRWINNSKKSKGWFLVIRPC